MNLTFLMTDIEGSALLWDEDAHSMSTALAEHDRIVEETVHGFAGRLIKSKGEGDATLSVFENVKDAAAAAVALQRRLLTHNWTTIRPVAVRMSIDTGEAEGRGDDFFGPVLNRCARLRGAGHGGQILLSSATARELTASASAEARITELGAFRLKGLKEPQRVYQLSVDDLPSNFKPLRALDVQLHNLPQQTASSVGREEELAEALAAFRSHRLVTIWGPGGAGKTHLALLVAAALVDELGDGAWWVDLAGTSDSHLVADNVARVLGMSDPKSSVTTDDLCDLLRARELLLVLDNCEHLLEPLSQLVSSLLQRCASVRIVTTSRERFGVPGEALLSLEGLKLGSVSGPAGALDPPAVRLFLERAKDVGVAVERLQRSDLRLVHSICARLEGLPLAIELAAAALATMSLSDLAEEVAEHLDVLDASPSNLRTGGGRRTMRGTLEWSFSRATEHEQRALVACSTFAGSFSLDAAKTIAECRSSILLRLVEQSLMHRDPVGDRYRLLAPVREFAGEAPGLEEAARAARNNLLGWLLSLTQAPDPVTVEWLDKIEVDIPNVRVGLTIASRQDPRALCEIVINLTDYWHLRGPLTEGRGWVETSLLLSDGSWLELRARLNWAHGFLASWLGDFQSALTSYERALDMARQIGAASLEARVLGGLGAVMQALGDLGNAQQWHEQALSRAREAHERRTEAASVADLGSLASLRGELSEASARYESSLQIQEQIGDLHGATVSRYNLGELAESSGEISVAEDLWRGCFESWMTLKDRYRAAATLRSFSLMRSSGDPERAAVAIGAAEAVIQLVEVHEPAWFLSRSLAHRKEECLAKLGTERYDQLGLKGADMSLEEAARYIGLSR